MKKSYTLQLLFTLLILTTGLTISAQNSISGNIADSSGDPLIGASITISGTTIGTITDIDGNYSITSDIDFPWDLTVSYIGYKTQNITATGAGNQAIIKLEAGVTLGDDIVISASKRAEKVTDAVASVSVLSAERIAAIPINSDATELIRNIAGVNIVKSGTQYSNVELRGPVTVNESNTLVMRDYAPLTDVSTKRVNSAIASVNSIDLARVEVVRGPAGALYGPNVTSGIVHYISKDPFKYTGTDVLVGFGEQNIQQYALRHAGNINNKFGYKILGSYQKSTDFALAEEDLVNNVGNPTIRVKNNVTQGGKVFENVSNTDQDLFQWNVTGQLDYRFNDKTSITYVGSLARQRENFRNQTAHQMFGRQLQQHQIRFTAGNLFVSLLRKNQMGNVDKDGNVREGTADYVFNFAYDGRPDADGNLVAGDIGDNIYNDLAAQYSLDINDKIDAVVGVDYKNVEGLIDPRVYGINSGNNEFNVLGAYASVNYDVSEAISINAAARVDNYDAYDATAFSPRIGGVYKINDANSIRLNYSKAFQSESRLRTWLDFTIPANPAFPETHVVGVNQEVSFNDPVTQFAFGQVAGGDEYQLADIINALATSAGVSVDASAVSGTVVPALTSAAFTGPGIGIPVGSIPSLDAAGSGAATLREVSQIELGYTGIVNQKLAITADVYYNLTNNLQPAGNIPLSAGSQLDVEALSSQISAALPNTDQATIDALNTALATGAGPAAPGGWGLIVSDIAQQNGYLFNNGFPTFGEETVGYLGLDVGATYYFTPELSGFANVSYVSKNVWTAEELGEANPNFQFFLNIPSTRANFGISYLASEGFYGRFAGNYQAEFEGKQGDGRLFTGTNEARAIFDLSAGYRMEVGGTKLDLGLNVNNVFNTEYKFFVHLPVIKRIASLTLKASF